MKRIKIILGLVLFASVSTFAQSPRIKLNQITKDTVKGSVLISSPSDSGMVYSRDFYIAYGADTVLILYGDTLAATSGIISSVLSDGVTITGDGTTGSELTVDTNTVIATKQDLDLYYLDSNPDGYTSNTGTVTSVGGTGTVNGISLSGSVTSSGDLTLGGTLSGVDLASQVTGTLPIANGGTGATTFTSGRVLFGNGTSAINTDAGLFWDNSNKRLDINTSSISSGAQSLNVYSFDGAANFFTTRGEDPFNNTISLYNNPSSGQGYGTGILFRAKSDNTNSRVQAAIYSSWTTATDATRTAKLVFRTTENGAAADKLTILGNGYVGIGEANPAEKLDVNGKVKIQDLTGTGGNAVYENGGVLGVASDARFKTYVGDIQNGIALINQLKPKYFIDNRNSSFQQLGFYAQEVKSVINEASYPIGNTDYLGINDRAILATTVKAIQEQQEQIETLQKELNAKSLIIETQEQKITDLETTIQSLITRIENLENK